MKQTVNFSQFKNTFEQYDRQNHFPLGLRELFNYLESYEEDTGEELEFDCISLCCDYAEEKLSAVLKNYELDSLEELQDNTIVIMVDDESDEDPTIIYQQY